MKYSMKDFIGQTMTLEDFNEKFGGDDPSEEKVESDNEESWKTKLDSFFDCVAEASDEEEEPQLQALPAMQTSRGVKPIPKEFQMINEHFDAMLAREYQDLSLGVGEDVEGCLADDSPQFLAACRNKRGWYNNQLVAVVGPNKEPETSDEINVKNQAIEYSKRWRETKEPLIEVCVPDPRSMQYNATNVPSIKNKNMPSIIKAGLLSYSKPKKKNGLSVSALKQHDLLMNTPQRDVDEETQTYKTMLTELSYRPLGETTEERRERKTGIKELRKGRREEKKINQLAHKDILLMTTQVNMNAKHCKTISMN